MKRSLTSPLAHEPLKLWGCHARARRGGRQRGRRTTWVPVFRALRPVITISRTVPQSAINLWDKSLIVGQVFLSAFTHGGHTTRGLRC